MAIEASAILPSDSLEEFRVQFNNLVVDVEGVTGGNAFVSTIIFEGSTADANETTILATDPTSDNVITLPDATGTFITTGNSGDPATTTAAADADHVLVNDGGVLKKITRANLGIGGTAGAVAADDLTAGDAAINFVTSAGNITIDAQGSNTDIIFKGTDGSSDITPMTLDMSAAGAILLTGGKIDLKNAGTASQILFYCESSNAHAQTLQSAPHSQAADNTLLLPDGGNGTLLSTVSTATVTNKTLTAPVINTATVGTSITPASDDGATLGSANLNWSDLFLADAGVINLGDDQDVKITHVADTGVLLNAAMVVQFRDSAINIGSPADGDLDINADDEIELNSTLIDINGNVEISGTAAITGIATFTDDIVIGDGKTIGSASAATAMTIASTGIVTFVDDILIKDVGTIGSASDPDAIAIGADGDVTLTQDLELQHDGAILSFGANDEVSLTHVHDTGILLNSTNVIQFNDASQNIGAPSNAILDINATDEIELNATLVDINANVEISGTATTTGVHTFTAVPLFPNNTVETADIQADAITSAKIADDAIDSEHYTDASIDAAHFSLAGLQAPFQLDATPPTDHTATGPQTNTLNAGYTAAAFDLVILGSSSTWLEADADATGTSINMMGLTLAAASSGAAVNVALPGSFVRDDTFNFTPGAALYVSGTLGAMTHTKPTGSGDIVRTVGYALTADVVFFQPSSDFVVLA